jgi:hypothetical protein
VVAVVVVVVVVAAAAAVVVVVVVVVVIALLVLWSSLLSNFYVSTNSNVKIFLYVFLGHVTLAVHITILLTFKGMF